VKVRYLRWLRWSFVSVVAISPAAAAEVELSKGRLTVTDFIATQVIAVKNNTTKRISTIYVECGFFHANTLLAAARYHAENVEAGQTAYIEVTSQDAAEADRSECRVNSITR
jgi:hypothetical protein